MMPLGPERTRPALHSMNEAGYRLLPILIWGAHAKGAASQGLAGIDLRFDHRHPRYPYAILASMDRGRLRNRSRWGQWLSGMADRRDSSDCHCTARSQCALCMAQDSTVPALKCGGDIAWT